MASETWAHEDEGRSRVSTWPPHELELRPWQQTYRGGTREDRMLAEVRVSLPPKIGDISVGIEPAMASRVEVAMREIIALDSEHGDDLGSLGMLLLRGESVASSKIEYIEASVDDYARALHGITSNQSAVSMVGATEALDAMMTDVGRTRRIEWSTIASAHATLMRGDPAEQAYAGRLRDMQNWIGGSDYSPRNALYVPPPAETVPTYVSDLMTFANRDDLPTLVQAGIAHAQFESVHPFTDGNGRIGRALINAILRRRGATNRVVVPLASALVAHRERYFEHLDAYRGGDPWPLVASFADSSQVAAAESRVTAHRLIEIPAQWHEMIGPARRGSAATKVLALLPTHPVLSAEQACDVIDAPSSSVYSAIERLREAGVLRPLTARKRNQVWGAGLILDELDDLSVRIARAAHA